MCKVWLSSMIVRKSQINDVDSVMEIIEHARRYFKDEGIPQWQGPYPDRETILDDIEKGQSYVCVADDRVLGTSAIIPGVEVDYLNIYEGEWRNDREYVCMHRVAVHPDAKGCGVAAALVKEARRIAISKGIFDLKCDTHEINTSMRRMLEKNGFEYCGIIYLTLDGEPRVAYQCILDEV